MSAKLKVAALACAAAGATAALARPAAAVTTSWLTPAGGAWTAPANWTAGVPVGGVDTVFAAGGTAPYTVSAAAGQANSINVSNDSVTFQVGGLNVGSPYGTSSLTGDVTVGADATHASAVTLVSAPGLAPSAATLYLSQLGSFGGTAGPVSLTIDGVTVQNGSVAARGLVFGANSTTAIRDGAVLQPTMTAGVTFNAAATIDASTVTGGAAQTFTVTGVGTVPAAVTERNGSSTTIGMANIGSGLAGGTLTVDHSSFSASVSGVGAGILYGFGTPAGQGFYIQTAGTGTLAARNGATVFGGSSMFVGGLSAAGAAATGTVTATDPGTTVSAAVLLVAANGGTGTVTAANGASVTATYNLTLGGSGGQGLLAVTGPGSTLAVGTPFGTGTGAVVGAGGTLSLASGGTAAVTGFYNQSAGATLAVALAGGTYADLTATTAALDGTLSVSLAPGFTPTAGEPFQLLSFGSETGRFATVTLPTLPTGLSWDASRLYTAGVLTAVPEPAAVGVAVVAAVAMAGRRRRVSRAT